MALGYLAPVVHIAIVAGHLVTVRGMRHGILGLYPVTVSGKTVHTIGVFLPCRYVEPVLRTHVVLASQDVVNPHRGSPVGILVACGALALHLPAPVSYLRARCAFAVGGIEAGTAEDIESAMPVVELRPGLGGQLIVYRCPLVEGAAPSLALWPVDGYAYHGTGACRVLHTGTGYHLYVLDVRGQQVGQLGRVAHPPVVDVVDGRAAVEHLYLVAVDGQERQLAQYVVERGQLGQRRILYGGGISACALLDELSCHGHLFQHTGVGLQGYAALFALVGYGLCVGGVAYHRHLDDYRQL